MTSEALLDDVSFRLTWQLNDDGGLQGELVAVNVSDHVVRLSGKPGLIPLGTDGEPLDAETIVTLELRSPGYAELNPGDRVTSRVAWGAWDGPPCNGRIIVRWPGGQAEIPIDGPPQPARREPGNLSTGWFT